MKRIKSFFKNSHNKSLELTTHFEENDVSPNYFLASCKMAGLSLALLSMSNLPAEVAHASVITSAPFGIVIDSMIKEYQKSGVLTDSIPNIKIVNKNENSSSSHIAGLSGSCDITISLNEKGQAESLIPGVDLTFNNDLYREASLNHEIAHCYDKKRFVGSGLSKNSERWFTEWIVGDYVKSNPIKNLFEENFADTYGMMLTLKNHDFSKSSVALLEQWSDTRKAKRQSDEKAGNNLLSNSHQTDFALTYLIDHLDQVRKMDVKDYPAFAMEAASRGVMMTLNKNREMVVKVKLNSNGDWVKSSAKNKVEEQGVRAFDNVITSYRDNIIDYAKVIKYKMDTGSSDINKSLSHDIPQITQNIINSTNVFEKINVQTTRVNNHEISWSIEGDENKNAVFVMLNGKKLDYEMNKLKQDTNYQAFIENTHNVLNSTYTMNMDSVLVSKYKKEETGQKIKAMLEKSPFEKDRERSKKMKIR